MPECMRCGSAEGAVVDDGYEALGELEIPVDSSVCDSCRRLFAKEARERWWHAHILEEKKPGVPEYNSSRNLIRSHILIALAVESMGPDKLQLLAESLEAETDDEGHFDDDRMLRLATIDGNEYLMRAGDAEDLYKTLKVHRHDGAAVLPSISELRYRVFASVVVAIHGALELYLSRLGCDLKGQKLHKAIEQLLSSRRRLHYLTPETSRRLLDLDATRHIIVHNGGIVDQHYLLQVVAPTHVLGDLRTLSWGVVWNWAQDVLSVQDAIHGTFDKLFDGML